MSLLVTTGYTNFTFYVERNDETIMDSLYRYSSFATGNFAAKLYFVYTDINWPRSRFVAGGSTYNPVWDTMARYSSPYNTWGNRIGGMNERHVITGLTLDQANNIAANAVVKLYNTANDQLVDTVVSDSGGYYVAGTPYTTNTYAVGYKPGTPDIMGTTQNNLTPV